MGRFDLAYLNYRARLGCYSAAEQAPEVQVTAAMSLHSERLQLEFEVIGQIGTLKLPATGPVGRADGLWTSTCFELFLASSGAPGYLEVNVSPDRRWTLYLFDDYRTGMRPAPTAGEPAIRASTADNRYQLSFEIASAELKTFSNGGDCSLNLCTILADSNDRLHYYTLDTAGLPPDFHNRNSFARVTPTIS